MKESSFHYCPVVSKFYWGVQCDSISFVSSDGSTRHSIVREPRQQSQVRDYVKKAEAQYQYARRRLGNLLDRFGELGLQEPHQLPPIFQFILL